MTNRLPGRRALRSLALCFCLGLSALVGVARASDADPIVVRVDATNTRQRILQVNEHIPVAPGPLRLLFPRFLPGYHGPYGNPLQIAGLMVQTAGRPLPWKRDPADPYAFLVDVPAGAAAVDLSFQSFPPPEQQTSQPPWTTVMVGLQWTGLVLYPAGRPAAALPMAASVKLPPGWQQGSALTVRAQRDGWLDFETESLETLVDSPLYASLHYRRIELDAPGTPQPMVMHLFTDTAERLQASDAQIEVHRAILKQAVALFGARHWRHYDLLLAIGEGLSHTALEHHESSENAYGANYFKDWAASTYRRDDLPHEFVHSWNGKYRRPADLWAPDFNTVTQNSLLWVYEGLTEYYGLVVATRSGLVSPELMRREFGRSAAYLRELPGRRWRNLQDTTNDAAMTLAGGLTWYDWQRAEDYYYESALLIWLDADTLIREATDGKRSLDDFARAFFGGTSGDKGPKLYQFEDVVAAMSAVHPHDWARFFRERLDRTANAVPLEGLERSGWRVAFAEKRSEMDLAALDPEKPTLNLGYSLGLGTAKDGKIAFVNWEGPAFRAGLSADDQIVAVGMQAYSVERLEAAVTANKGGAKPLSLLVKRDDDFRVVTLDVRTGLRYPLLERLAGKHDWMSEILAPK